MTKDHWKALAIATAAVAIVTNAGAYYTRRTLEAELAEARAHSRPSEPVAVTVAASEYAHTTSTPTEPMPTLPAVQARAPKDGEQCIGGELFRKVGSEWEQLHRPC